jgi:hypothetical protein
MVLTKDSNPARVVGTAGRHRLGESKKLTPGDRRGDGLRPAKAAGAADGRLSSADPAPQPVRRKLPPQNVIAVHTAP